MSETLSHCNLCSTIEVLYSICIFITESKSTILLLLFHMIHICGIWFI